MPRLAPKTESTSQSARELHIRLEGSPAREGSITVTIVPAGRGDLHLKYEPGELRVAEGALYVLIVLALKLGLKPKKKAYHPRER